MAFSALPAAAAWQHRDARLGFEVAYFQPESHGLDIRGWTTAVEDGQAWVVSYAIELDQAWTTRSAQITGRTSAGTRQVRLEADGRGRWRVDGEFAPWLHGCLDVDLESSALTNALPVHRMSMEVGARASASAAYVRATSLRVERLEQDYTRTADEDGGQSYDYAAPVFDFACRLRYDAAGLVLDYPGIAVRAS